MTEHHDSKDTTWMGIESAWNGSGVVGALEGIEKHIERHWKALTSIGKPGCDGRCRIIRGLLDGWEFAAAEYVG